LSIIATAADPRKGGESGYLPVAPRQFELPLK
jgi:hypothetical protein